MRAYQAVAGVTRGDFIASMRAHREADRIVQRTYWDAGRGCAVGCGVESVMRLTGEDHDHGGHAYLADVLGIPLVLVELQDRIFEGLPLADALNWSVRFFEVIPDGADLSGVWNQFAPWMLRTIVLPYAGGNAPIVRQIAEAYERSVGPQEMQSLQSVAYAAYAEAAAGRAATAYAAYAAAYAAYAAAAADAAADAASFAAFVSASIVADAWQLMANKLCELMAVDLPDEMDMAPVEYTFA